MYLNIFSLDPNKCYCIQEIIIHISFHVREDTGVFTGNTSERSNEL